jgi:hypothetical protein
MIGSKTRLSELLKSNLNGVDFVEVIEGSGQKTLRVHFHTPNVVSTDAVADPIGVVITGGDTITDIKTAAIKSVDWSEDPEGRPLLELHTDRAGDFATYTLTLSHPKIDPYYRSSQFSFKATCPSDLDCATPPVVCPPVEPDPVVIDYLAKDFLSFRNALSEFSAVRYPGWQERSEADVGTMLMEVMCAVADDLSYYQDRIAAEAALDTSTERRSLVRLARMVDYEPRPATSASALVQFSLPFGVIGPIPTGLVVSGASADGTVIEFETGSNLADVTAYPVHRRWNPNSLQPYWWDDSQRCLLAGSTEAWILGHGLGFSSGQAVVIETVVPNSGEPPVRELVHLAPTQPDRSDFAVEETDQLFSQDVTHIRWSQEEKLSRDHDLTISTWGANVVPISQGRRRTETFAIKQAPPTLPDVQLALQRTGPRQPHSVPAAINIYPLREEPLAWLPLQTDPTADPVPEIQLTQLPLPTDYQPQQWKWRRSLLDSPPFDQGFTVDPAAYRVIARRADRSGVYDYDGDGGDSVRFGDGVFGEQPEPASAFQVTYRVTAGKAGNLAADAINRVQDRSALSGLQVRNVFPAQGGNDAQLPETVRRLAPERFRAQPLRAVVPPDYVAAAKTLAWVAAAGATFRWTGSWLTVFATADPLGTESQSPVQRLKLIELLNRFRMTGYEVYCPQPRFASIDLTIKVCATKDAFSSQVRQALITRLGTGKLADGTPAFFAANQFGFGVPLERSRIEGAVQSVPGVAGVLSIQYRLRGQMPQPAELGAELAVAPDRIIRVDNDPNHPDRGVLTLKVEGGR